MGDSLAALQAEALRFRDEREWGPFHRPKDLVLGLVAEVGELAELFLWKTDAEIQHALRDPDHRERVADELADVQVFLLYLADLAGVPLDSAVRAKIAKNAVKYPVDRARGSARKYDESP
jgi:NTP pyrophosphatase (non-canonical NTP hydrolase)